MHAKVLNCAHDVLATVGEIIGQTCNANLLSMRTNQGEQLALPRLTMKLSILTFQQIYTVI